MTYFKRVGRISYVNADPFFYNWPLDKFPVLSGVPRQLALAAQDGDIIAAPLPVVECWNLEHVFSPLGSWCISVKETCQSVLVFSHRPFSELNNITMGLTRESSTSVVLCDVLIQQKYGHRVNVKRGLQANDDAWLVIGDEAMQMASRLKPGQWEYVTDLATEWWNWHHLPFVFATWVAGRLSQNAFSDLLLTVENCLAHGQAAYKKIAVNRALDLQIPSEQIVGYLNQFSYVLNDEAIKSLTLFRELAHHKKKEFTAV